LGWVSENGSTSNSAQVYVHVAHTVSIYYNVRPHRRTARRPLLLRMPRRSVVSLYVPDHFYNLKKHYYSWPTTCFSLIFTKPMQIFCWQTNETTNMGKNTTSTKLCRGKYSILRSISLRPLRSVRKRAIASSSVNVNRQLSQQLNYG